MLVYIIVFKEDTERKRLLTARFREIGLEPTFIDAIRGSELPTEEQKKFQGLSRKIWAKEAFRSNAMGCALSHFQAWNEFQSLVPMALLFSKMMQNQRVPQDYLSGQLVGYGQCGAVRHCVSRKPDNSEQEHYLCWHRL